MPRRHSPSDTKFHLSEPDSDSIGFVLAEDLPPDFVEATTRYEIRSELGRGGAGIVYKARDVVLERDVAVKILRFELMDRPHIIRRFEEEAQMMSSLQHPGVAHVFECGNCEDGRPFHAMKLVEGKTLQTILEDVESSEDIYGHVLNVFTSVTQTMAYTHSKEIAHLDLKPANVMVGQFGEVHVMDWGTAKGLDAEMESNGRLKKHGTPKRFTVGGTLEYMPPEQALGTAYGKTSDVFSLGAMLCRILTGKPPFAGETRQEMYDKASNGDISAALRDLNSCGFDTQLIRLTKHCLNLNPDDRPVDAAEVAREMSLYHQSKVEQAEGDLERFFELSLDLFCIAGFDGFFRRINSNFTRILGYPETQLLSTPFLNFIHDEDRARTIEIMDSLFEGKPVIRFRNRYRTSEGSFVEFEWTAQSVPKEDIIFAVARHIGPALSRQHPGQRRH